MHDTDVAPDVESVIMKQIKRFGGTVPDRISTRPVLAPALSFVHGAFFDLDTERSLANLDPIPWSSIVTYAEYYELDAELTSDLIYLIRSADNAYLRRLAEKRKR